MLNKVNVKSGKNECNAHVAKQFRVTNHFIEEKEQTKIWPEAFNPYTSDQKTFPESPSLFPASRH